MKKPDWREWIEDKEACQEWLNHYLKTKVLRPSKDEAKLHLKKTDHNLNIANWLVEKHQEEIPKLFGKEVFYDWVITMHYYSIYHAALALVSREGYASKGHSPTLCFLIYHHYHLQKKLKEEEIELIAHSLEKEDIESIGSSKEMREKACYNIHETFEQDLSQQIAEQAVHFVNKIKEMLR